MRRRDPAAPLRVTTMVDSLQVGGAERVAVELACALDRTRFAPHVIVTRDDGPLRALLEQADVPITLLGRTRRSDVLPWITAHRHLRHHTDLLHAHKFGSNAWGTALSRSARVPLVAHEHNFSEQPSRSRRAIDRHWIARRAARVLCVSESVAEVERANGVPERLIEVLPNAVRLDAALPRDQARAELGLTQPSFTVGIVGCLRPEKAHEVLLAAVALLARAGRDIRLCVVGDGPLATELRLQAARLGVESRVAWAGERRDAARLAGAFDVSVISSHWEGLPLAALEAMAAGVPLVATQVGGLPSLVRDGAGVLVPPADPAALADALGALMDDPAQRARIAHAGRLRVEREHAFETLVARVEHVYDDVVGRLEAAEKRYERAVA